MTFIQRFHLPSPRAAAWSLAILVGGLLGTAYFTQHERADAKAVASVEFNADSREIEAGIAMRVAALDQSLRGTAAFFADVDGVTRGEFHEYVSRQMIGQALPPVQDVGFALRVAPAELMQHLQEMRAEGFHTYRIWPEGERETYAPIVLLEPFAGRNRRAIGYDMFSEPVRRAAMERARDRDELALAGRIALVQESGTDPRAGAMLFAPVYRRHALHATVAGRRADLIGWVYSAYLVRDLISASPPSSWELAVLQRIRLEVFDGETATPGTLLYDSRPQEGPAPVTAATPVRDAVIEIAGRRWLLRFTAISGAGAEADYSRAWLVLGGGAALSLLLAALVLSLASTRAAARVLATRMTAELQASEAMLNRTAELAMVGGWETDLETGKGAWSVTARRVLDVDPPVAPATEADRWKFFAPEAHPAVRAAVKDALENGTPWDLELPMITPKGRALWIRWKGAAVVAAGRAVRLAGVVQDITERKQAEVALLQSRQAALNLMQDAIEASGRAEQSSQALRVSESRWKFAVEGAGDGLWDWNVPASTVFFTKRWKEMLGFAEAEIGDGLDEWSKRVHPDDLARVMTDVQAHLAGTTPVYANEHRVRCKDGSWKWILDRGMVVERDAAGQPLRMIGTHSDISARKQAAEREQQNVALAERNRLALLSTLEDQKLAAAALRSSEAEHAKLEAQLRQSQKMEAVGTLAGGVAHDFNNILTVIIASCSFLEDGLHAPDPRLEDVRTITDAAHSAAQLTRQLLAFGRRQVLEPRPLVLNALVAGSEKMLSRLIGEDVEIRVEPAPALGLAFVDPGQVEQVIINLAVNARDAMPEGGTLTIATSNVELDEAFVSLHAGSSAGPCVKLAVTDTGTGMDAATLARIFEPFFTTKEMGKGTGLGLSTVYGIVKQSGGFITVDSAPGRGTTFEIYLPRVEAAGQAWQPSSETGAARGRGETILVVEDNGQLRAAATRILTKLGYRIFGAAGLAEAKRVVATEGPIHLLLTDVVMPGGSGRDVSLAVTTAHPAAKVLYMSGFTNDVIVKRGVLESGLAFLVKPFTPDSLGRKVRDVLDG